ncbi:hypothetical protein ACFS07_10935 [Undibacterium arcticum]
MNKSQASASADVASNNVKKTLRDIQRLQALRTGQASTNEITLESMKTEQEILDQQLQIIKTKNAINDEIIKANAKQGN